MQPPKSIKLIRAENVLVLEWEPGHPVRFPALTLRCECQCAGCVDEITHERILDVDSVPRDIAIHHAQLVGNYSMKLTYSDGHDTGLYTWEHFERIAQQL